MKGKVCAVTGANSGVGFETALSLARLGAETVMVCRDRARGEVALGKISGQVPSARLRLEVIDLASLAQVRELATALSEAYPAVHLLVNNAGVYSGKLERTEDGFERTFAVNHLAHFLLTHLLLPRLLGGKGRVINVSSDAHRRGRMTVETLEGVARGPLKYSGMRAYCDSKLANALFAAELARRYGEGELSACALHPGVLATRIWNQDRNPLSLLMVLFKPFMGRPSVGGDSVVYLAAEPAARVHGRYFNLKTEVDPSPLAQDPALARALWELSLGLVGLPQEGPPGG